MQWVVAYLVQRFPWTKWVLNGQDVTIKSTGVRGQQLAAACNKDRVSMLSQQRAPVAALLTRHTTGVVCDALPAA